MAWLQSVTSVWTERRRKSSRGRELLISCGRVICCVRFVACLVLSRGLPPRPPAICTSVTSSMPSTYGASPGGRIHRAGFCCASRITIDRGVDRITKPPCSTTWSGWAWPRMNRWSAKASAHTCDQSCAGESTRTRIDVRLRVLALGNRVASISGHVFHEAPSRGWLWHPGATRQHGRTV